MDASIGALPTQSPEGWVNDFLRGRGSEGFDKLSEGEEENSEELVRALAEEAARSGRMDVIEWLADKLGGIEILLARAPAILEALLASGYDDLIEALAHKALFGKGRKRKDREKMPDWEINLLQLLLRMGDLQLYEEALDTKIARMQHFQMLHDSIKLSLVYEARHPEVVDFLAEHGAKAGARIEGAESAIARAARASEDGADWDAMGVALRLAGLAEYDEELSADVIRASLAHPRLLEAALGSGANPNVLLEGHQGALRVAIESGFDESARLLARAGADPYRVGRDGLSAIDFAKSQELADAISAPRGKVEIDQALREMRHKARALGATA